MVKRRTITITGISTILVAGAAYLTWRKSEKRRLKYLEKFGDWKKDRIANVYYKSLDERDVAWG